jgi:hypothetical protein
VARFAGGKAAKNILRAVPGLSTALVALDVADVVAGPDSLGNKGMDAVAMGIGGTLGAVGGPLGIAAGAGLGKMASDATQFVFGGGKSAEQRKLEEALKLLQQRVSRIYWWLTRRITRWNEMMSKTSKMIEALKSLQQRGLV